MEDIDLYTEEYISDPDENKNQEELGNGENQETENKEDDENEEKKKVKPKRVIKNPRPKLDAEALKGCKGLLCLETYFKSKKYKGHDNEEEDLRTIMKTYEYWCHRLFPKFPFDHCLAKIEKLGTKKDVQTYIKRIRTNLVLNEDHLIRSDNEDENLNETSSQHFDDLLSQQDHFPSTSLTEEQLERIRLNKERAKHIRQEKLQNTTIIFEAENTKENYNKTVCAENIENNSVQTGNILTSEQDVFKNSNKPIIVSDGVPMSPGSALMKESCYNKMTVM